MKQDAKNRQVHGGPVEKPHQGTLNNRPLDGSQYVDVVEEQVYSELRPTRDAREPHVADLARGTQPAVPDKGSQSESQSD